MQCEDCLRAGEEKSAARSPRQEANRRVRLAVVAFEIQGPVSGVRQRGGSCRTRRRSRGPRRPEPGTAGEDNENGSQANQDQGSVYSQTGSLPKTSITVSPITRPSGPIAVAGPAFGGRDPGRRLRGRLAPTPASE